MGAVRRRKDVDRHTGSDIAPAEGSAPADEGTYLRATVTYSDRFGGGKTASAVSVYRVEAPTLANAAPSFANQDDDEVSFLH